MSKQAIVVGAGLAGLTCARVLHRAGIEVRVLERDATIGGRVQTDEVDGFLLDRGFQILLTGYPELRRHLDLDALDLRAFEPGATLWTGEGFETIGDPLRRIDSLVETMAARSGSFADKLRVLGLRTSVQRGDNPYAAFEGPDTPTSEMLVERGFSSRFVQAFFRPFLSGVFLEPELATSSRFFRFVFRMFASGDAAIPARGMAEIPRQLAGALPRDAIETKRCVANVTATQVQLDDGTTHHADAVIVACDAPAAQRLLPNLRTAGANGVTCLYFDAPRAPSTRPILHLDAVGEGPINNLHVASAVSQQLAPVGRALVSATHIGTQLAPDELQSRARQQLRGWFGPSVEHWRLLRSYVINYALPSQLVGALDPPRRSVRTEQGVFVCGDHLDQASIDGAMVSGRRAADAVLQALTA